MVEPKTLWTGFQNNLFQALCQCGRLKKWAGDERIPLVARLLFQSSSLTKSLEQAGLKRVQNLIISRQAEECSQGFAPGNLE